MTEDLAARRDALLAARAARAAERAAEVEAARLEREVADLEALDAHETQHGPPGDRWVSVDGPEGVIIVSAPSRAVYARFRDQGVYDTAHVSQLVRPCVAHPKGRDLDRLLDAYPAMLDRLADAVHALAHGRAKALAGKSGS